MRELFRRRVLPYLIFLVYSALKKTWRVDVYEPPAFKDALARNEPIVFAHWHGDEMAMLYLLPIYKAAVMTSTSKDGELMDTVIRLLGSQSSRGSSTRGGASALRGILRLAKSGWRPTVAVDGPKGPYHKVKPGVFEISRIINGPIFPLTAACDRAFIFSRSWNKTYLPKPFARIKVVWGEPLPAVAREQDSRDPSLATRLEVALNQAGQQALQRLSGLETP